MTNGSSRSEARRGDAEEKVDKPIQISIEQRHKAPSHQSNEIRQLHWSKQTHRLLLDATTNRVNSTTHFFFCFQHKLQTQHLPSNCSFSLWCSLTKYFILAIFWWNYNANDLTWLGAYSCASSDNMLINNASMLMLSGYTDYMFTMLFNLFYST